jgi:hypothetical protein
MDLELSHDILCRRAAQDNRRADRGHLDLQQYIISPQNHQQQGRRLRGILVCFVCFVVSKTKKLVCIRVNSWFTLYLL